MIPFWRGEAPARTDELSAHVSELREKISTFVPCAASDATGQLTKDAIAAVTWLKLECGLDDGQTGAVDHHCHLITRSGRRRRDPGGGEGGHQPRRACDRRSVQLVKREVRCLWLCAPQCRREGFGEPSISDHDVVVEQTVV